MPSFALQATTATLPPPLRHVRKDVPKTIASTVQAPLRIAFPLDGSRVDIGFSGEAEEKGSLVLKASGGVPPLTWMVDGAPVETGSLRPEAALVLKAAAARGVVPELWDQVMEALRDEGMVALGSMD